MGKPAKSNNPSTSNPRFSHWEVIPTLWHWHLWRKAIGDVLGQDPSSVVADHVPLWALPYCSRSFPHPIVSMVDISMTCRPLLWNDMPSSLYLTPLCLLPNSGLCPPICHSRPLTSIHLSLARHRPTTASLPAFSPLPQSVGRRVLTLCVSSST